MKAGAILKFVMAAAFVAGAAISCSKDDPEPASTVVVLSSPANGAEMDNGCLDQSNLIEWNFVWNPVTGATKYQLYVIGASATIPLVDLETSDTSYLYSNIGYVTPTNAMGWIWRVRAFKGGAWMEWSEEGTFDVESLNADC